MPSTEQGSSASDLLIRFRGATVWEALEGQLARIRHPAGGESGLGGGSAVRSESHK